MVLLSRFFFLLFGMHPLTHTLPHFCFFSWSEVFHQYEFFLLTSSEISRCSFLVRMCMLNGKRDKRNIKREKRKNAEEAKKQTNVDKSTNRQQRLWRKRKEKERYEKRFDPHSPCVFSSFGLKQRTSTLIFEALYDRNRFFFVWEVICMFI